MTIIPQVLVGQLPAELLVNLSSEELASDGRRQDNEKIRDYMKKECERGQQATASTDMFQYVHQPLMCYSKY
jgi:transcription elongation factor S-II